jgi:RimJ/RimL family protein N-acetyltransferase
MRLHFETTRLSMRPFEAEDARRIAYLAGEYDVARMCGRVPHPYSLKQAEEWLATQDDKRQRGDYSFAITLARDGLVGSCGVTRTAPDTWEIGYWLGMPYWGMGYASEAAQGLMDWAGVELDARVFTAGHYVDNPASGHVLRKLGFAHAGSAELFGLARGCTSPVERYVWPPAAAAAKLGVAPASHSASRHGRSAA